MATMPLVAREPWVNADNFAKNENDLFKLFQQQAWQAEQNDLTRAQQNNTQQNLFAHQNATQQRNFDFQSGKQGELLNYYRERDNKMMSPQDGSGDPLSMYRAAFREAEREKGMPDGFLDAVGEIESGSGRNTRSKTSSANGVFQLIKSTAAELGVKNSNDPVESAIATAEYARRNAAMFRSRFGRDPDGAELYLMHQQGPAGGAALLTDPGARAVDVLTRVGANGLAAVLNNGGSAMMTAGQFADLIKSKYAKADNMWRSRRNGNTQIADASTATPDQGTTQPPTWLLKCAV